MRDAEKSWPGQPRKADRRWFISQQKITQTMKKDIACVDRGAGGGLLE